jgi:Flp pilus assembly protein TadD
MPDLSVIMIVKNEAGCLARCLDSVCGIADEIVIADTGSEDATMEIARGYGAKVFAIPWEDDFAAARNRTIAAASGGWLLHMDADEVLDAAGAAAVRRLIGADGAGADADADAIEVTLANYCDDPRAWRWRPVDPADPYAMGFAGYIAVPLLRLFRAGRGFEYREPVHENITESVREAGGVIRRADIVIHHYGYDPEASRRGEKATRYLEIARKKLAQHPESLKAIHDFAEQALASGLEEEAECACRRALGIDPLDLDSATTLANILLNRGCLKAARTLLERLEKNGIAPPHVVMALGALAWHEGRASEARQRLERVVETAPENLMARLYLGRVLDGLGETAAARGQLERLTALAPVIAEFRDAAAALRLREEGAALFGEGKTAAALEKITAAVRRDPENAMAHNDLGVVLHAAGEAARARVSLKRALKIAPGLETARQNLAQLEG